MTMHFLNQKLEFPSVKSATREGIVAVGGDLSPGRLMLAYRSGIFPWFEAGDPVVWWSPDPRMVLFPDDLKTSKSMRNILNRNTFTVTFNSNFDEVIKNCRDIKRDGQRGTWITDSMTDAYCELHQLGFAKSVEVWREDELVGGLYGVDLGHIFCGESMFSKIPNASKVGFIALVNKMKTENYKLLDCQIYNKHLEALGAVEIPRDEFLQILNS